jgi:hypothetical protein
LEYALEIGLPVFPCKPADKKPLTTWRTFIRRRG